MKDLADFIMEVIMPFLLFFMVLSALISFGAAIFDNMTKQEERPAVCCECSCERK